MAKSSLLLPQGRETVRVDGVFNPNTSLMDNGWEGEGRFIVKPEQPEPKEAAAQPAAQPITPTPTPPFRIPDRIIDKIKQIAHQYWHEPDWEGIECVMAFYGAYRLHESNPAWLHVIGPSSSGKTSLGLAPIDELDQHHWQIGSISENSLLSGLTKGKDGGKKNSFLHKVGNYGLLYMPDLTNFLGQREEVIKSVAGRFREIHDGKTTKLVGSGVGDPPGWQGRVSIITAFTPNLERVWLRFASDGERFAILRWRAAKDLSGVEDALYDQQEQEALDRFDKDNDANSVSRENKNFNALDPSPRGRIRQWMRLLAEGKKNVINADFQWPEGEADKTWVAELEELDKCAKPKAVPKPMIAEAGLSALVSLVVALRTNPSRPDRKNIAKVDSPEAPGRLYHQLLKIARGWAFLHRREVELGDLRLSRRLAVDSIPAHRKVILDSLVEEPGQDLEDLANRLEYNSLEPLVWDMRELVALKMVSPLGCGSVEQLEHTFRWNGAAWSVTDRYRRLAEGAGLMG